MQCKFVEGQRQGQRQRQRRESQASKHLRIDGENRTERQAWGRGDETKDMGTQALLTTA